MKILKGYYILSLILLSLFSIAILGASGHRIINFKNVYNNILISCSIVFIATVIAFIIDKVKQYKSKKVGIWLVLLNAIVVVILFGGVYYFLGLESSVDINPYLMIVWFISLAFVAMVNIRNYFSYLR